MFSAFSLLSLVALSFAETIDIQVGQNGLTFTPDAIAANVGDQLVFHFHAKNHSVTQSSFAAPCGPNPSGFNSGFMPVAANQTDNLPTFTITVNDTKPIWVYCAQAANTASSHCGAGMVFAANCGLTGSNNSFANFQAAALAIGQSLKDAASTTGSTTDGYAAPSATAETSSSSSFTTVYGASPGSSTSTPTPAASTTGGNVHLVTVGASGFTFNPPEVSALPGDIITFEFHAKNHSVTQSSFASPCQPLNANGTVGFDSGFMPVSSNLTTGFPTWNLTVNNTTPIWVHCAQTGHCQSGMVFAINSNDSSQKSYSAFQALAMGNSSSSGTASQSSPPGNGAISVSYAHVGLLSLVLSISAMLL